MVANAVTHNWCREKKTFVDFVAINAISISLSFQEGSGIMVQEGVERL